MNKGILGVLAGAVLVILVGVVSVMFSTSMLPSAGTKVAVVDTVKLISESKLGMAGDAHLKKVREVLQNGMNALQKLHKDGNKAPETQASLQEGRVALERQFALEKQAVGALLDKAVEEAVKRWIAKNDQYEIVTSRQTLLGSAASADVTDAMMEEMNALTIEFPALPTVTINDVDAKNKKSEAVPAEAKPSNKR